MLAGDEAALAVAGIAICVVRRLAIDAHASCSFIPAHDAVVGDVAPKQTARISEIDGSLAPAHARGEPLDTRERQPIFCKARVEDLDRRVGIALARRPTAERGAGECRRRGRAGSSGEIASREFHGMPPVLGCDLCGSSRCYPSACANTLRMTLGSASSASCARRTQRAPRGACASAATLAR